MSEWREGRVDTIEGEIRGVTVRCDQVLVAGHVVEMTCPTGVAEAEQVYGKRWDDELDRHFQQGMFAMDRMSAEARWGRRLQPRPMWSTVSAAGLRG